MNPDVLLLRAIGGLTLAGAVTGLLTTARQALAGDITGIGWPVTAAFVLVYCAGLTAGALLLRPRPRAAAIALPYWVAQVPVFGSPLVAYYFGAGVNLYVSVGTGGRVEVDWFVGTHFGVSIGAGGGTVIGVNVVAAAVVALLLVYRRKARRPTVA